MNIYTSDNSVDNAILEYQKGNINGAESICSQILNKDPNNSHALYLFGTIFQKQGKNDLAIDYINKAIAINAVAVAEVQQKINSTLEVNTVNTVSQQDNSQNSSPACGFEKTRELLKRFENTGDDNISVNPPIDNSPMDNPNAQSEQGGLNILDESTSSRLDAVLNTLKSQSSAEKSFNPTTFEPTTFQSDKKVANEPTTSSRLDDVLNSLRSQHETGQDQPMNFSINTDNQPQISTNITENLSLFFDEYKTSLLKKDVLLWPGVETNELGIVSDINNLSFSVKYDELKPPSYYTLLLKSLDVQSMDVVQEDNFTKKGWDIVIIPFEELKDIGLDNFLSMVSFNKLAITGGLAASEEKSQWDEALNLRGFTPEKTYSAAYNWEDKNLWGEHLIAEGKVEEGVKCFENILEKDPNNLMALNNLGVISFELGNAQSAETFILKALEVDPKFMHALLNIADIYISSGHIDTAAEYLQKALDIDNQNPSLWKTIGDLYKKIGQEQEALGAYNKCQELTAGS